MRSGWTFTVLGPVGAAVDGTPVQIAGRRERAVLSVLLAARGDVVSTDRLIDAVWGTDAPSTASSLHVAISRLRSVLEPTRVRGAAPTLLISSSAGYALRTDADTVDADLLVRLSAEAHAAIDRNPWQAERLCTQAEALWHGPPYADGADCDLVHAERARLADVGVQTDELRAQALLATGRHTLALGDLEALLEAHPYRERLWEFYALALYRGGRQADALAALRTARARLGDELGIDPSPALQQLEQAILRHDPALAAPDADAAVTPSSPVGRPALIGRDVEYAQLRAHLAHAAAGRTSFVLVEGEPGIGKTRLLEETSASARASGLHVVWGRCPQADVAPAFWPWLEVLRALRTELPAMAFPHDVAALLEPDGTDADAEDLSQARRFRLFDAVARTLAGAGSPLLVVLEDLHWADAASAQLLHHLVDTQYDARLAVAVSLRELDLGRQDAVADVVGALSRRAGVGRIRLAGVAPAASAALLSAVVDRPVDPDVAAAIHRCGEGNPFCMGELAQLLASSDDGLEDAGAVDRADVPARVRDVVRRRLATLPERTRRLVELAAVVGREFDLPVLVSAADRDVDACLDDLEPALVSRVITPVAELPGRHRFAHALVTEAALAEVSSLRAARLHARVADALLAVQGERSVEVVAGHLWSAAAVVGAQRAAEALERAADLATRRTAYEAAQDLLERAVTLRAGAGTSAGSGADEAELVATLKLAGLRRARFGYSRAFEAIPLDRPKELALRTGRRDLYLGLVHLHWGALATSGRVAAATELAQHMYSFSEGSSDPVVGMLGDQAWGVQCWHLGRLREAAVHMHRVERALAEMTSADLARVAVFDSPAFFSGFAVHVLELAGEAPDADARLEVLAGAESTPYDGAVMANFGAFSAVCAGDVERALRWGRRGVHIDSDLDFAMFGATAQIYTGWALALDGDPDAGLALLTRGLDRFRDADAQTAWAAMVCLQVEAMLAAGRPLDEVQAALDVGAAKAEAIAEPLTLPYLDVARAQVATRRGDPARAEQLWRLASDGAQRTGNTLLMQRIFRLQGHDGE